MITRVGPRSSTTTIESAVVATRAIPDSASSGATRPV